MLAGKLPGGDQARQESGEDRREGGTGKDAPVRSYIKQGWNSLAAGHEGNEKLAAPVGKGECKQRSVAGKNERFSDELANGLPWTCSQSDAGADLLTTADGSGRCEARQIYADDQQNESNDAEKQVERPLDPGAEVSPFQLSSGGNLIELKPHGEKGLPALACTFGRHGG